MDAASRLHGAANRELKSNSHNGTSKQNKEVTTKREKKQQTQHKSSESTLSSDLSIMRNGATLFATAEKKKQIEKKMIHTLMNENSETKASYTVNTYENDAYKFY